METTVTDATPNTSSSKVDIANFVENEPPEVVGAKQLARRYRLPYIDLLPPDQESPIDYEVLAKVPVDLMLRNHFVPLKQEGRNLHAAMADPSNLEVLDELENALNVRIVPYVATQGAIDVILKRGDATQRVLQEAAQGFKISLVKETEQGEEVLDLDRLATVVSRRVFSGESVSRHAFARRGPHEDGQAHRVPRPRRVDRTVRPRERSVRNQEPGRRFPIP